MGLLVEGKWVDQWYDTAASQGRFQRTVTAFRNWITPDGAPGPSGIGGFAAEKSRYHLYVSLACPWAHRTLIFRHLKKLEDYIAVSVVHPLMLDHGWTFVKDNAATGDALYGLTYLYELYIKAKPDFSGRTTVPVLWDTKTQTIVSNESAEIIRMFNTAFNHLTGDTQDFYPKALQQEIDALNSEIYDNVNNGVYKAGFATTQTAYEEAVTPLFACLDRLEARLKDHGPFLFGQQLTEADWRLFTTLVRFDAVYVGHFKCNLARIADYPALSAYLRRLYRHENVAETVNFTHIKQHYYGSHKTINPTGIVPAGPKLDFILP